MRLRDGKGKAYTNNRNTCPKQRKGMSTMRKRNVQSEATGP